MTVKYVGLRDKAWGDTPKRGAEIAYDEDNRKEVTLFERTANLMTIKGWNIDTGVASWAWCEVEDRNEYDKFMADWQEAKKCIANCMRFGF